MAGDWFGNLGSMFANPQFKRAAGDALSDFGYGLATAPTFGDAFGAAAQRGAQLMPYRDQMALDAQAKAEQQQAKNQTIEWLRSKGYNDLVQGVESGALDIGTAYAEGMRMSQPQTPDYTAEQRNFLFAQQNPEFASFINPTTIPSAPSGYQWVPGANGEMQLSFIPGGPADPALAAQKPPTEAERKAGALTTVTQQDAVTLFGDGTPQNPGVFDAMGGWGDAALQVGFNGVTPLSGFASNDFKVAKDAIGNIAQSYLYAMSGATAPPEEVRKLADMVTPGPLDTPQQKEAKRARLLAMYQAIEGARGNAGGLGGSGDGWEVLGVQ